MDVYVYCTHILSKHKKHINFAHTVIHIISIKVKELPSEYAQWNPCSLYCQLLIGHDIASYCVKCTCGTRWQCIWNVPSFSATGFKILTLSCLSVLLICGDYLGVSSVQNESIMLLMDVDNRLNEWEII